MAELWRGHRPHLPDHGYLDAVIRPRDTRRKLIQALDMLENKRDKNPPKKHGNIPL